MPKFPWILAAVALLVAASAQAQTDPILDADPLFDNESPESLHAFFGDLSVWGDSVRGFSRRDDVERLRSRLRFGWRGLGDQWEAAAAVKASFGSDDNRDNRRNNDNERSNAVTLDEAFWRWLPSENSALTVGQTAFAISLSPMLWDADLRPIGVSVEQRWSVRDFDSIKAVAGYFAGNQLYGDRSRIAAGQIGWVMNAGAPFSVDAQLAWLQFSGLEEAVQQGLARSNRRAGSRLLSEYRLLDLQLGARWLLADKPLSARLDLLRNTGADDLNDAARFSLVYGNARRLNGWEFGAAWQRIQRDAALAIFNDDDWWFHSDARGVMPWIAYGWEGGWGARAAAFVERRDGADETLKRLLLEVRRSF